MSSIEGGAEWKLRFPDVLALRHCLFASIAAVSMLSGCAGSVPEPHIYSKYENKGGLGVPQAMVGATGEQRYCAHGLPQQVSGRKQEAYANIAEACGGEDQYSIIDELSGSAHTVVAGIETGCAGLAGRVIYFKCRGAAPKPTGSRK
ncbi:MAG: hypothetical protein ABL877_04540 [Thiobacillus sp.]